MTNAPLEVSKRTLYVAGACSRSAAGLSSAACARAGAVNGTDANANATAKTSAKTGLSVDRRLVIVLPASAGAHQRANFFFKRAATGPGTKAETSPPMPAIWRTNVAVIGRTDGDAGRNTV